MVRVKICCISSKEEAQMAIKAGASAIGLVSEMPSGPGVIAESDITEIVKIIPPGVATFLLTSKQDTASIIAQQHRCKVNTLQLCDRLATGKYEDLHNAIPGIKLVQVVHVIDEESIEEAIFVAPFVDAILLDSGNQRITETKNNIATTEGIKELGGTGRTHNWELSKTIRESVSVPVFLAGGLNPSNVGEAIKMVRPYGVDICSGVRTNGKLDGGKLKAFFTQIAEIQI